MSARCVKGVAGICALLWLMACSNSDCGGTITPLSTSLDEYHRIYDGVQTRVTDRGLEFVEQKLPEILDSLMGENVQFDIPSSDFSYWGVSGTICQQSCPAEVRLRQVWLSPLPPNRLGVQVQLNLDTTVTLDSWLLGSCQIPVDLRNKLAEARLVLEVDPLSGMATFSVEDVSVNIFDHEYEIQCPAWYDWLLELLKGYVTGVLNNQLAAHLDQAGASVVDLLTCLPCDFYSSGCPSGTYCSVDGFCEFNGVCTARPLGLSGIPDLSKMAKYMDPAGNAIVEMMLAPGQLQAASQRALVRDAGLDLRWITGVNAERCDCVPEPMPGDVPAVGVADEMPFDDLVPGRGSEYMLGLAVSDQYLDHLFYHAWRAGLLCLDYVYDDYKYDWLNSQALELFIPSLAPLNGSGALPGRLTLRPQKVPQVNLGPGGFPDADPTGLQLQAYFRDVRMALWLQFQGRWVRILEVTQDIQIDLGLDLTPENQIIPVQVGEGITILGIQVTDNSFLGEDLTLLDELVPYLASLVVPKFAGLLEKLAIPTVFGFSLDVQSVQGEMPIANSEFYKFATIYANLHFEAPPPGVDTRAALSDASPDGFVLEVQDPDQEIQYRVDGGLWSAFQPGPRIEVARMMLPGPHEIEIRARETGAYRTLDATPEIIKLHSRGLPTRLQSPSQSSRPDPDLEPSDPATGEVVPVGGCSTAGGRQLLWLGLLGICLTALSRFPRFVFGKRSA